MKMPVYNHEHLIHRIGWIRAATLGANDGVISISSLLFGMISGGAASDVVIVSAFAGLVAGAASMAAGEWVSVMSQADAEDAELRLEKQHIESNPHEELLELQMIYEQRGLKPDLAKQVAEALTEFDAVESHARDELGLHEFSKAKPMQAAVASAMTFLVGGGVPIVLMLLVQFLGLNTSWMLSILGVGSLGVLSLAGAFVAKASRASVWRGALRVTLLGAVSMLLTAVAGKVLGQFLV